MNAAHIMGRINTAVVHETAVMEGSMISNILKDQYKVAEKLGSCTSGAKPKANDGVLGIVLAICHIESHTNGTYTVVDDWVMSQVKQANALGSSQSDSLNLVQRLMNEGKMTGYCSISLH